MKDKQVATPSDQHIIHVLNGYEYYDLDALYGVYKYLISDYRDPVLSQIPEENVKFDFNTESKVGRLVVRYNDRNKHWHSIELSVSPKNQLNLTINYYFHGKFGGKAKPTRSFCELLMTELLQLGYDVEDYFNERRLVISVRHYRIFQAIVDVARTLIICQQPLEWYFDKEPLWEYDITYYDLIRMLPKLREEATKERWKDVKPENFVLHIAKDYCMIRLDYVEEGLYEMRFQIGCKKDSFCAPAYDKYIDCSYRFHLLTNDTEVGEYYRNQNIEYCKLANTILDIACNWKALFFHSDDGLYISTERQLGFQKYCLMLDFALALKNDFKATEPLITSSMINQKKELESMMGSTFEVVFDDEQKFIFTKGKFRTDPVILESRRLDECQWSNLDCPF